MGGDGPKFQVPDWRIYGPKVDEIPLLREHKAKLAVHGLKDPWIRNEAWKFMPENCHIVLTPFRKAVYKNIFRDVIPAVALAFLTVQVVKKVWPDEHHDDH